MKRLIINADDLGLTEGVNRAIFELQGAGALTSATLMAANPASDTAAREIGARLSARQVASGQAAGRPVAGDAGFGVGCHVVLVDGTPLLPASEIPTLIDPRDPHRAAFRPTLGGFIFDLMRGRIREAEIEAEAAAQIRRLRNLGIAPTHVDTHKHTHMFPRVLRPLLRAALLCGVGAIRKPFEPEWSIAATPAAGLVRRAQVTLLRTQRRYFVEATRQSGLLTTGGAAGVLATGTLDAATMRRLLGAMPDGTWELVCHPGYLDPELNAVHTRLRASREVERQALLDVIPHAITQDPALKLIHFGHLADAGG